MVHRSIFCLFHEPFRDWSLTRGSVAEHMIQEVQIPPGVLPAALAPGSGGAPPCDVAAAPVPPAHLCSRISDLGRRGRGGGGGGVGRGGRGGGGGRRSGGGGGV